MVQMKTTVHTQQSYDKFKAEWAKRLQNFLRLDGLSFAEALEDCYPYSR